MKLLIVTQAVDQHDPVLGFFHRWLEEFAQHTDVIVIAQRTGEYQLPENVTVYSLGKETGAGIVQQIVRFWSLCWRHRREYQTVFVHMITWWMVLGGPLWMITGKRRYLWYEHRQSSLRLRLAVWLAQRVFSVSKQGMPLSTSKSVITGHGIDTTVFCPDSSVVQPDTMITVGRISPSKRVSLLLDAFATVKDAFRFTVVGAPVTSADKEYARELERQVTELQLNDVVTFRTADHREVPQLLQQSAVFLHASETGLDKAVLEALACGCLVISAADNVPEHPNVVSCPADQLVSQVPVICQTEWDPEAGHTYIQQEHSLSRLIRLLFNQMSQAGS